MKQEKNLVQQMVKRAVQGLIEHELDRWPPDCMGPYYQPYRPETPMSSPADELEEQ